MGNNGSPGRKPSAVVGGLGRYVHIIATNLPRFAHLPLSVACSTRPTHDPTRVANFGYCLPLCKPLIHMYEGLLRQPWAADRAACDCHYRCQEFHSHQKICLTPTMLAYLYNLPGLGLTAISGDGKEPHGIISWPYISGRFEAVAVCNSSQLGLLIHMTPV